MALPTGVVKGFCAVPFPGGGGSGPAGRFVGGVVTHEGVGDAVGAMGQSAGDDAAVLTPGFESLGIVLGCRLVEPQAHTEVDQSAAQRHTAFAADAAVAAFVGGFILHRGQP